MENPLEAIKKSMRHIDSDMAGMIGNVRKLKTAFQDFLDVNGAEDGLEHGIIKIGLRAAEDSTIGEDKEPSFKVGAASRDNKHHVYQASEGDDCNAQLETCDGDAGEGQHEDYAHDDLHENGVERDVGDGEYEEDDGDGEDEEDEEDEGDEGDENDNGDEEDEKNAGDEGEDDGVENDNGDKDDEKDAGDEDEDADEIDKRRDEADDGNDKDDKGDKDCVCKTGENEAKTARGVSGE